MILRRRDDSDTKWERSRVQSDWDGEVSTVNATARDEAKNVTINLPDGQRDLWRCGGVK